MSRYFEKISKEDFVEGLIKYYNSYATEPLNYKDYNDFITNSSQWPGSWNGFNHINPRSGELNCKYEKDLDKIDSSWENYDPYIFTSPDVKILAKGLNQLSNGLIFGCWEGGGDWEQPYLVIVYWDGKNYRGYTPKLGNTYNEKEKSAYGNNVTEDIKILSKLYPSIINPSHLEDFFYVLKIDEIELIKDIEKRIIEKV